jgi:hypothetical protein
MPTADFFHRYIYALGEIHASFDLEATQNAVVRNAVMLFGARGANLMLFNPSEENLLISASFGLSEAYRSKGAISPRKSLGETIDRVPVIVRDVATDPRVQYPDATVKEASVASWACPWRRPAPWWGPCGFIFPNPGSSLLRKWNPSRPWRTRPAWRSKRPSISPR